MSVVWKRPELSDAEFRQVWLGEHVTYAKKIPGVLEYVIDFATEGPSGSPAGIATLRFESRAALERAFSDPELNEHLRRTREQFARTVQIIIVDEHQVVPPVNRDGR